MPIVEKRTECRHEWPSETAHVPQVVVICSVAVGCSYSQRRAIAIPAPDLL
jgi:hypothetical protein